LGVNAQVHRINHQVYGDCIIKYFDGLDSNQPMQRELEAFNAFDVYDVSFIPKVFEYNAAEKFVIYEYIEGNKITEPTDRDLAQVIKFIGFLKKVSSNFQTSMFPAKHACFSSSDLWKLIYMRFCKLTKTKHKEVLNPFLEKLYQLMVSMQQDAINGGYYHRFSGSIPQAVQILSPSDISFNNMVQDNTGKIHFIDFEFFGWDDPVKLVSDFLWHPQNSLSRDLKSYFIAHCVKLFADDNNFVDRLKYAFPCYGLVWIMILLNNFVPEFWQQKVSLGLVDVSQQSTILARQLSKAEAYLENTMKSKELICSLIVDQNICAA
jgi:hypothetical protein